MTRTERKRARIRVTQSGNTQNISRVLDFGFWDNQDQVTYTPWAGNYARMDDWVNTSGASWNNTVSWNAYVRDCDTCATNGTDDWLSYDICVGDDTSVNQWVINVPRNTGVWAPSAKPVDLLEGIPNLLLPKPELTAEDRAKDLLLGSLSPSQRAEFMLEGYFHVKSPRGFLYRITQARSMGVLCWDPQGGEVGKYCLIHTGVFTPVFDQMLTQKLMLEMDEEEFLKIANFMPALKRTQMIPLPQRQDSLRRQAV
jgi:hypothetical protein